MAARTPVCIAALIAVVSGCSSHIRPQPVDFSRFTNAKKVSHLDGGTSTFDLVQLDDGGVWWRRENKTFREDSVAIAGDGRRYLFLTEQVVFSHPGIEGQFSRLKVTAYEPDYDPGETIGAPLWTFEADGDDWEAVGGEIQVTKYGCCDGPDEYSYFSAVNGVPLARTAMGIWVPAPPSIPEPQAFVDKDFLIVKSTSSFDEAKRVAEIAATTLGIPLDLRGLSPNKDTGLSFSADECRRDGLDYPCYVERGRYDDGTYVSIEWSSAYRDSPPELYLVIVASDVAGSMETDRMLDTARRSYPGAYAQRTKVYMGCIH